MAGFADSPTLTGITGVSPLSTSVAFPALTILWHPDPNRVGEMFIFDDSSDGQRIGLSRLSPIFPHYSTTIAPLADPFVSRRECLEFLSTEQGLTLAPAVGQHPPSLGGEPLHSPVILSSARLAQGAVLTLGRRIALCLHLASPPPRQAPDMGLVGHSDAMNAVRASILSVADLSSPVLIRGETGTGKELVANAIVANGGRRNGPFVPINIAAVPPQLVAAQIFGHEKGAFTDAARERNGYFHQADGGTLFLDEIGLAPPDVQAALLRVLETGEVVRLGGHVPRRINVRVLAATDSDLLAQPERGQGFSPALLHRLSGVTIQLPPLRERPADLGLLFLHFLRQALAQTGDLAKLDTPANAKRPWIDAGVFVALAACRWPGNVRQLRNFATELAVKNRGASTAEAPPALLAMLNGAPSGPPNTDAATPEEQDPIAEALSRNEYQPARAARALNVSRSTIYEYLNKNPHMVRLSRLSDDEFLRYLQECGGDLRAVAKRLRVSHRAVQLRFSRIGRPRT
jgi:two-component system nitrogen regulation response regulator GlnG